MSSFCSIWSLVVPNLTCLSLVLLQHYQNSDNVFPRSMPYCDVDLTPHWDYDLEKAVLLSCELETEGAAAAAVASAKADNKSLTTGLAVGLSCVAVVAAFVAFFYMKKAKDLEAEYVTSKAAVEA